MCSRRGLTRFFRCAAALTPDIISKFIPDVICGDMDSAVSEEVEECTRMGAILRADADQGGFPAPCSLTLLASLPWGKGELRANFQTLGTTTCSSA